MTEIWAVPIAALVGVLLGPLVDQIAYRAVRREPFDLPTCRTCQASRAWNRWWASCRRCGARPELRVWAVSVLSGVGTAGAVAVVGITALLPAYALFAVVTAALVVTDLEAKLIPNRILYPATAAFALLLAAGALITGRIGDLPRAALGGLGFFLVLLVVALVARGGFGFGDVKLAVLLGLATAFLGWRVLAATAAFTALLGGIPAIVLLVTRRARRDTELPYGPAMIFGSWLALVIGERAADWYLG